LPKAPILCQTPLVWPLPSPLSAIVWVSELVLRHRQRCSKRASHCGQIYTARHAPLIRPACSIDLALCVRAGALVSQFAEECGDAPGNRVGGPQAAPRSPQGAPPTHQHPVGGGWRAIASSGVSGARVVAAPGGGLGGLTPPEGPRRPGGRAPRAYEAPEGLRGAQGAFRGGISASPGAPLRSYHPLLVGAPIWPSRAEKRTSRIYL
jgi:hypothetical protein